MRHKKNQKATNKDCLGGVNMPEWQRRVGRIWEMKETPIVGSTSQNGQIPVQLFTIFMGWVNIPEGWVNIKQKGGSTWSRIYSKSSLNKNTSLTSQLEKTMDLLTINEIIILPIFETKRVLC
jgi:hypothetical protein